MSCVDRDVHRIGLALVLVSATAFAEGDERFEPAPGMAVAVGFAVQDSQIGALHESGLGVDAEGALGTGRTQFFGELSALSAAIDVPMNGPRGTFGRGGVGVRWLARQFQPEREFGFELYLEAVAGVERFWWDGGGQLTRPDLGIGIGWQLRSWELHNVTMRTGMRVMFAPTDPGSSLVACRGSGCPTGMNGSVAGIMGGLSIGW